MGSGDSYEMGMPVNELLNTFGRLDGFKQKSTSLVMAANSPPRGPKGFSSRALCSRTASLSMGVNVFGTWSY